MMELKSGRTVYANQEIFGIDPELNLTEGYDGSVDMEQFMDGEVVALTKEDLIEIADMMIDRWQRYKKLVSER